MSQSANPWWKGAVFYQIYPRSFKDSSGNGVGDLPGATSRLEHLSDLGVDAIWLSPFYKSPMVDFGYDISDYNDVDPLFGTLNDFDAFLDKAHKLGIKVIIDMVLLHTSKDHPWFIESRKSRDNPKSDWFMWADPKPDGTPPNNWMSIFGGVAWTFETRRAQFYMHHFLKEQPTLNYHNPDVQDAALDACRFWLERGIDGFRLDVINYIFSDQELRDNPPKDPEKEGWSSQFTKPDPYSMQHHVYDKSRPEALEFAKRFRKLMDEYPGTMTLAEIGDDNFVEKAAEYTSGDDKYNTAYNFSLMTGEKVTASKVRNAIEEYEAHNGGWPSWSISNHDVIRACTRWNSDPKMLLAMLCSLRGTIFMYQGEELGLSEAEIPYEKLQDPWGKYLWPEWQGRDGCRTPMPWDADEKNAGFSDADETWLPIPEEHLPLSVKQQEQDKQSTLNFSKMFLAWRKNQPALISGDIEFLDTGSDTLLAFKRTHDGQSLLCVFNFSDKPASYKHGDSCTLIGEIKSDAYASLSSDGAFSLPSFGFGFASL